MSKVLCYVGLISCLLLQAAGQSVTVGSEFLPRHDRAAELRAQGPSALARLCRQRDELLRQSSPGIAQELSLAELEHLIESVATQRYAHHSRLFWYTDLNDARSQSAATGKPILSLRLLGRLDDELSCANSRFFRVVLYPHPEISALLREQFILHWESVRPVPVLTVDFGNGKQMKRTITGNSIHYVLDEQGRPLDALPGLQSPAAFLHWLNQMVDLSASLGVASEQRSEVLTAYHQTQIEQLDATMQDRTGLPYYLLARQGIVRAVATVATQPDAKAAMQLAIPKSAIEMRPLQAIMLGGANVTQPSVSIWERYTKGQPAEVHAISRSIIAQEHATLLQRPDNMDSEMNGEAALDRLLDRLQRDLALDTARNEQELHRALHQWYCDHAVSDDVRELNDRVYAELFLAPRSDAWMGLYEAEIYTALTDGGIVNP